MEEKNNPDLFEVKSRNLPEQIEEYHEYSVGIGSLRAES
jgi:hypothetical protein